MLKENLINKFKKSTYCKDFAGANIILQDELITNFKIKHNKDLIEIQSEVLSDNYFNEYKNEIEIDPKTKDILSTYCSCDEYEKNELRKNNYACKHIISSFFKFTEELDTILPLKLLLSDNPEAVFKGNNDKILDSLIDIKKEEIKIEVYINRMGLKNKIHAEFKIGLKKYSNNKCYVVKDINQLLISYINKVPISYGKDFSFDLKNQHLSSKDKRLFEFLLKIKDIENINSFARRQDKYIDGKKIIIPDFLLEEFIKNIAEHRIYLDQGFFYRPVEGEVIFDKPNIDFSLKKTKNDFIFKMENEVPDRLNKEGTIFIYGSTIYVPNYDYSYNIKKFYDAFNGNNILTFNTEHENKILSSLLPKLYRLTNNVNLSKNISDIIVKEAVKFNFYFDKINNDIVLILKVKYGKYEFNIFDNYKEKFIYRDNKKEDKILSLLRSLGFENIDDKFYLLLGDSYLFNFFKNEIVTLQELGNVYYSENFKVIKNITKRNITAEVSAGKYDYFDFKFKIADIPPVEVKNIILALRDNLKFYKLKTGEFIDLENIELKNFISLLDVISLDNEIEDDVISINKNKAIYINEFIEKYGLRYIKGRKELKKLQSKLADIKTMKFELPKNLNANLREYQVEGYNWLKTLDYLGFGGILGDEMGLGKTIQAISFILSSMPNKTLIVAPTSLIYNWSNEFDKFAPSIRYKVINGNKPDREKELNNLTETDVLITTYNLLKKDIDIYKNISFDYFFIDEAQYIKNNSSKNSLSVKEIKSNRRFALSGTPLENSLMDLWSIFDFVMPGYLFDEKRFSVRYHKKLKESEEVIDELNMLIKPFILKRYKKDVIKELPDKIEKKLFIPMDKEQQKIYKTYSDYAIDLINKKVQDDDLKNSKIEILSYITKLRQICLDPSVLIDNYIGGSGKMDVLVELLEQSILGNHKILVFSQFTSVLKNISTRLNDNYIKHLYLDGSIPSNKRIELVNKFNEEEDNKVFLISLKAGGTGFNLTSADIVIHFDPWWNPAVEDQATDRAHRYGQDKVVEVIKLISKNSIEEKIIELQDEKRSLINKIINNEDFTNISNLSDDDILSIFSLN